MNGIGALRAGHGDEGSAAAFLPILGLLVIAGAAALIGISLQPGDSSPAPAPAPVTAADFGPACVVPPGTRPSATSPVLTRLWYRGVVSCVDREFAPVPGYASTSLEGFSDDVVVVRWNGTVPTIVAKRVFVISEPIDVSSAVVSTS